MAEGLGHAEAEAQLLEYLQQLVTKVHEHVPHPQGSLATHLATAEQIVQDEKLLRMTGTRSAVDPEARIGHKTKSNSFFGYKQHTAMLADDEIITSMTITPGNADDGQQMLPVVERTTKQIKVKKAVADKGYCSSDNDEDSDQMICPAGIRPTTESA